MYCVKTNVARSQFFSVLFGFFLLLSNKFTIWLGFQLKKTPTNLNPINCNTKIPLDFSSILKQNKLQRYFTYLLTITQSDGTHDLWEFLTSIKNWNNRNIMLHMMGSPEEQRIRIIIYQTASIRGKPYWAWRGWADQKRMFFSPPQKAGVMTYITPLHLHNFASGSNALGSEKEAEGKAAAVSRCSVQWNLRDVFIAVFFMIHVSYLCNNSLRSWMSESWGILTSQNSAGKRISCTD